MSSNPTPVPSVCHRTPLIFVMVMGNILKLVEPSWQTPDETLQSKRKERKKKSNKEISWTMVLIRTQTKGSPLLSFTLERLWRWEHKGVEPSRTTRCVLKTKTRVVGYNPRFVRPDTGSPEGDDHWSWVWGPLHKRPTNEDWNSKGLPRVRVDYLSSQKGSDLLSLYSFTKLYLVHVTFVEGWSELTLLVLSDLVETRETLSFTEHQRL